MEECGDLRSKLDMMASKDLDITPSFICFKVTILDTLFIPSTELLGLLENP
jgi:hypothetical protein